MPTDIFALFRRFRHDLLNDLQIVSGHVQLGRPHQVLRQDVQDVIDRILEVSQIFTCRNNQLALAVWGWVEQARDRGVSVSLDLCEITAEVQSSCLEFADQLLALLLPEIERLADEEHWVHLRLDATASMLQITVPLIPVEALLAGQPGASQVLQVGEDEELLFSIQLSHCAPDQ